MGTHTCVISRAGSNASDTSTAANFSWQIGAGSGSNPVNAADFPGGVFPSGTGTVAAGAASATITFQSNPDATFEPDETGVLTVTTTQNGVTITGSPQPFTITNDDADPGSGGSKVVYSASSSDTGPVDLTNSGGKMETMLNDTVWITDMICAATGQPGYRLRTQVNGRVSGFNVASDGTESQDGAFNYTETPSFSGVPMVVTQTAAGDFTVTINGTLIRSLSRTAGGTYIRHRTGGAAVTTTITKN